MLPAAGQTFTRPRGCRQQCSKVTAAKSARLRRLEPLAHVEVRARLIDHVDVRAARGAHRDRKALQLAAGQVLDVAVHDLLEVELVGELVHDAAVVAALEDLRARSRRFSALRVGSAFCMLCPLQAALPQRQAVQSTQRQQSVHGKLTI
jgi:hypothetical protein